MKGNQNLLIALLAVICLQGGCSSSDGGRALDNESAVAAMMSEVMPKVASVIASAAGLSASPAFGVGQRAFLLSGNGTCPDGGMISLKMTGETDLNGSVTFLECKIGGSTISGSLEGSLLLLGDGEYYLDVKGTLTYSGTYKGTVTFDSFVGHLQSAGLCYAAKGTVAGEPFAVGSPCPKPNPASACKDGCNDNDVCTKDTCDEKTGKCENEPIPDCGSCEDDCDDGKPCTKDICRPDGSCDYEPDVGATCDDGIECTTEDKCDAEGKCVGINECLCKKDSDCDDSNPCSADKCDPETGKCVFTDYSDSCKDTDCETAVCDGKGGCTKTPRTTPGPNSCVIGTTCVANGAESPSDACQKCVPAKDNMSWTAVDGPGCVTTVIKATTAYNDGPAASASLAYPYALALDDAKEVLYILDRGTGAHSWDAKIRALDLNALTLSTIVGPPGQAHAAVGANNGVGAVASFARASDITYDVKNNLLYVADYDNCLLRKVDLAAGNNFAVTTAAGGKTAGGEKECNSVDGALDVARLQTAWIDADSQGNVYFNQSYLSDLRVFKPGVGISTIHGGPLGTTLEVFDDSTVLAGPYSQVRKFDLLGNASDYAGIESGNGCVDGYPNNAKFWTLVGLSVLPATASLSARVFVAGAHTLREIYFDKAQPAGWVSTLAGVCGSKGGADGGALTTARLGEVFDTVVSAKQQAVFVIDDNGLRRYGLLPPVTGP